VARYGKGLRRRRLPVRARDKEVTNLISRSVHGELDKKQSMDGVSYTSCGAACRVDVTRQPSSGEFRKDGRHCLYNNGKGF